MKCWSFFALLFPIFVACTSCTSQSLGNTFCCCNGTVSLINGICSCTGSSAVSTFQSFVVSKINNFFILSTYFFPAMSTMFWNCMPKHTLLCNSFNHSIPNQNFRNHRHLCNQFIPTLCHSRHLRYFQPVLPHSLHAIHSQLQLDSRSQIQHIW